VKSLFIEISEYLRWIEYCVTHRRERRQF